MVQAMSTTMRPALDIPQHCVTDAVLKLLAYCESRDWAGIDPYDALNSRIFNALPLLDRRIPRLILTQALKRLPFNIRPLLLVPPTQNPKSLGLFLTSLLNLSKAGLLEGEGAVEKMAQRLVELRSNNARYWCWGYSFPWQTRTLVVPTGTPNLVCTTFVANALLDAYERHAEPRYLEMAASSAEYLRDELFWSEGTVAGFAYPLPSMRQNIHNGNFLGAALFCRVARHTGKMHLIEPALRVARYSASRQRADGSWVYGEMPKQGWIDNFHTGYNLCALHSIARDLNTTEFDDHIRRGFDFYLDHFFREDGAPRYFHNQTHPIDIHCAAQSILTLLTFQDSSPKCQAKIVSVFRWTMDNMWDPKGYFYYRLLRSFKIKTSYMRWSQAWMLLALSTLLDELQASKSKPLPAGCSSVPSGA